MQINLGSLGYILKIKGIKLHYISFFKYLKDYLYCQLFLRKRNIKIGLSTFVDSKTKIESNCNIVGARLLNSEIGSYSYIGKTVTLSNIKVGRFTSIAADLVLLRGQHPTKYFVSTSPCFYSVNTPFGSSFANKNLFSEFRYINANDNKFSVIVGNDVWIGYGVRIMEGLEIGNGSVIAAGSLVTKNIPPYEIWGGVPARKLSQRFTDEQIEKLLRIAWWNESEFWIKKHSSRFNNIEEFLNIKHGNI